jgi:hypothetical protein
MPIESCWNSINRKLHYTLLDQNSDHKITEGIMDEIQNV